MSRASLGLEVVVCLMVVTSCGREAAVQRIEEPSEPGASTVPLPPPADTVVAGADSPRTREIPNPVVNADSLPLVTVGDLLGGDQWVGERVRVRGTCIGYSRALAGGPQPQTRSDWQLLSDGSAIWVVGPYPQGCSGTTPADAPANFVFEVAQDTLRPLGPGSARARRYLLYAP